MMNHSHPQCQQQQQQQQQEVLLAAAAAAAQEPLAGEGVAAVAAAVAAVVQLAVVTTPHTPCGTGRGHMQHSLQVCTVHNITLLSLFGGGVCVCGGGGVLTHTGTDLQGRDYHNDNNRSGFHNNSPDVWCVCVCFTPPTAATVAHVQN